MPLELQAKLLRVLQSGEVTPSAGRNARAGRRAHHRRHPPRPGSRPWRTAASARTSLPAARRADPHAAAARAARGHPALAEHFLALREELGGARAHPLRGGCRAGSAAPRLARQRARARERHQARPGPGRGEVLTPRTSPSSRRRRRRAAKPRGAADLETSCEREVGRARMPGDRRALPGPRSSASSARCSRPCSRAPAATRSRPRPCWASTATRCARRSSELGIALPGALECVARSARERGARAARLLRPPRAGRRRPALEATTRWSRRARPARAGPRWCSCAPSTRPTGDPRLGRGDPRKLTRESGGALLRERPLRPGAGRGGRRRAPGPVRPAARPSSRRPRASAC